MGEVVGCPGVPLRRSCCHWGPSGPPTRPDPPHAPPWPGAGPHSRCLAWQEAPVPDGDPGAPSSLVLHLSTAPSSPVLRLPGAVAAQCSQFLAARCSRFPCARGARSSWFSCAHDFLAPGSLKPRLSGARGFPVSPCCSFPVVPACGCPRFYRFPMPTASRFPGAATPDAPGSPVPTVFPFPGAHGFPSPRCPRFSRSLVTCFPMFLVLQLSSAHG